MMSYNRIKCDECEYETLCEAGERDGDDCMIREILRRLYDLEDEIARRGSE